MYLLIQITAVLLCLQISECQQLIKDSKLPTRTAWFSQHLGNSNFTYRSLYVMLHKKEALLENIHGRIETVRSKPAIVPELKFKMEVLSVYQRELKATETSLFSVLQDLNQTLSSDYRSLEKIKKSCHMRLEDLKDSMLLVEEDYNTILELEKEMQSLHPNTSLQTHYHLINEILSDISHAADDLESALVEDVFSDLKRVEGAAVETVVKLSEGALFEHSLMHMQKRMKAAEKHNHIASDSEYDTAHGKVSILIDSSNNQYILSRPRDITIPVEDHHFVHDIVNLVLLSFLFGGLCALFKVPSQFGYMFAGMVLGPSGYNTITSVVQVETIGEFGVMLIVFMLGLEFSPDKLRKVWGVSVYGSNLLLMASILLAVALGWTLDVHPRYSLLVAGCLYFSSNPLATKMIDGTVEAGRRSKSSSDMTRLTESPDRSHVSEPESDIGTSLGGILVMQDVQLGTLVALLPFFMESKLPHRTSVSLFSSGVWFIQLLQVMFGLPLLLFVAKGVTSKLLEKFYKILTTVLNKSENFLLGSIAVCFLLLLIAELFGASLELGCFLAGVAITSQKHTVVEQIKRLVEPVRDFLAVFFFASLGFHVFPTFLKSEFTTVCIVALSVMILKFLLAVGVLGVFLGHCKSATWIISFSLAQVSEFSFILASRARRMGILSREVYLIILSITALNLLLAPLLWQLVLLNTKLRHSSIYHSICLVCSWSKLKHHIQSVCLREWGT